MSSQQPSVTAVMAAYQSERWIGEALEAILSQTRPPDEVIVVNDGSTDGTDRVLARFGGRIRVISQSNRGCPAAFNTAYRAARGDFIAMCGADDVWERQKLQWQLEAIRAHPEVDVLFGETIMFGKFELTHIRPPGSGLLDADALRDALFRENVIGASSILIRRSLFERLGPFIEDFGADDLEYWMRCLRAGAQFYFEPRPLVRYRRHEGNLTNRFSWMHECTHEVRRRYASDVANRALVAELLAADLFRIGRRRVDEGRPKEARRAFLGALRYAAGARLEANLRAAIWVLVLSLPLGVHKRTGDAVVRLSRMLDWARGGRHPVLP
jgi:glycosyltransferase involved in cell wall biosynthesis